VILYLDSSSLVKIYVEEAESDLVRDWVDSAEVIATSRVAFPETLSAFSRRREEGDLDPHSLEILRETLAAEWPRFLLLPVKERRAGHFALKHRLRGFDAIHLAAVSDLRELLRSEDILFSAFDKKLLEAARAEGIDLVLPSVEDLR
jgi:uncharacterized protein